MVKKTLIFALNVFGHEIGSYLLKLEVEEQKETKKKLWLGALEENDPAHKCFVKTPQN